MGTHQPLPPPPPNGDYVPNNSEKTDKQKAIDEWLPINSSRSRKWWFSAFHNVTAMVGAGVLSLPYAMSQLGWGPGVFIMIKLTYFIMIFASVHFVLSHLPNFDSISGVSLAAAVMSLSYSTIAWGASLSKGVQPDVQYGYKASSTAGTVYQLYAMPVFDMIETLLVKKLNFQPSRVLRFIVRNSYVAITMFFGITFPFFGGLLGFFGGLAFAPTTYFLPCIMWLAIYKPRKFGLSWWANWFCIVVGVLLMVLSPIGGLRTIIIQAKDYKFYS
ncbi:hypothetical protein GQ457_02G012300 [Hibiscus cannabinus]